MRRADGSTESFDHFAGRPQESRFGSFSSRSSSEFSFIRSISLNPKGRFFSANRIFQYFAEICLLAGGRRFESCRAYLYFQGFTAAWLCFKKAAVDNSV